MCESGWDVEGDSTPCGRARLVVSGELCSAEGWLGEENRECQSERGETSLGGNDIDSCSSSSLMSMCSGECSEVEGGTRSMEATFGGLSLSKEASAVIK